MKKLTSKFQTLLFTLLFIYSIQVRAFILQDSQERANSKISKPISKKDNNGIITKEKAAEGVTKKAVSEISKWVIEKIVPNAGGLFSKALSSAWPTPINELNSKNRAIEDPGSEEWNKRQEMSRKI